MINMPSINPDNHTRVILKEGFQQIRDIFDRNYEMPFTPVDHSTQLITSQGDIESINTTIVKPLSKTWVDKTSNEIRSASQEEIEEQYESIITDSPDHLSIVVTSAQKKNGLLHVQSYCSRSAEHELLVGSLLENNIIKPDFANRVLNWKNGGILIPTIFGKQRLVITGVVSASKPLKDLPNDSLLHLSAWGSFPENERARQKIQAIITSIGEGLEKTAISAFNQTTSEKITNPLKLVTIYDTVTERYLT